MKYTGDQTDVTALVKYAQSLEAENDRLRAERLKLDRRIHNQRKAWRDNWEIYEMRGRWIGSEAARRGYIRLLKENRRLRGSDELTGAPQLNQT